MLHIFKDRIFLTYFNEITEISVYFFFSHLDSKAMLHLWQTGLYHPDFANVNTLESVLIMLSLLGHSEVHCDGAQLV